MKSVKMFGKSVPLIAIVMISMLTIGAASAALLTYYGSITTTATVGQSVLVDDTVTVTGAFDIIAGGTNCVPHYLRNRAEVPAKVEFETSYNDPSGVTVSYRKLPFEVTTQSGQNAINKAAGHPYIEWTIVGNEITFDFVNPTASLFAFDYRVDGELGTVGVWSSTIISGGELVGQEIGPSYNIVNTPAGTTKTVTVTACEEVQVGLRLGAENDWYLAWIIFGSPALPTQITLEPEERLDFSICYEFDVRLMPGSYIITTGVKAVP